LLQYGDCPNAVPLATIRQILAGHLTQSWSVSRGAAACFLWALAASEARATGAEPARDVQVDPAPCVAAAASNEDDKSIEVCGALIDNEKTARADRVKALIARGDAFARKDMIDRAIGDYDAALLLDPGLADVFNARGELWRRKGDRPKALSDFGAAIKLNPAHAAAKASYKSLAQELEKIGALMAVAGKPTFIVPKPAAPWKRRSAPTPGLPISTARSTR